MLLIDDRDGVRLLTMNRPERLNAFDVEQHHQLADALAAADADAAVRVVVLTGAGRAFSSGADLRVVQDATLAPQVFPAFERFIDALGACSKPVIAAVNGLAVGVGTTLLLHCDLVLADAEARFRTPFPQLGTTPEAASSLLLPRAVGAQFANWMLLTGEWVDADTAWRAGLVAKVSPAGMVLAEALALARTMAELQPGTLAMAKRLVRDGLAEQVLAARQRETEAARELSRIGVISQVAPPRT